MSETKDSQPTQETRTKWWKASLSAVGNAAETVKKTASQTGMGAVNATGSAASFIGNQAVSGTQAVAGAVKNATSTTANAAVQGGKLVGTAATSTATAVGNATTQAGKTVATTTVNVTKAAGATLTGATDSIGSLLAHLEDNSNVHKVATSLNVEWLLPLVERIDIEKAEAQLKKLQQQYPEDTPRQIANRIMMQKALLVGGSGVASSLVPGAAAGFFALDLAASTAIQAEMGYQIAGAYGLDLHDSARKGEILGIFGLVLGSKYAMKTGLQLMMRNVPVAGAVVGAGTNAATLYTVGHMACSFYARKTGVATLEPSGESSDRPNTALESNGTFSDGTFSDDGFNTNKDLSQNDFLAIFDQQLLMDQLLVHVFLAGDATRTWDNTRPTLSSLNLSPSSIEALAAMPALTPVETLVADIDSYFAQSLLAQCQQMAEADGVWTATETAIVDLLAQKLQ